MKNTSSSFRGFDNNVELRPGAPAEKGQMPAAPAPIGSSAFVETSAVDSPVEPPADPSTPLISNDDSRSGNEAFAAVSPAESNALALSPEQRTAIELLTSGHTLVSAATAAGVSRMTLYRWLHRDAVFAAAFNAWQKDILDTARGRLLSLSDLAITTVAKSMSRGDARTALKLLDSIGALNRVDPGSTDAAEIQRLQNLEELKAKTAIRKAEARAEMESYEPL